jgi:hypothetical protein
MSSSQPERPFRVGAGITGERLPGVFAPRTAARGHSARMSSRASGRLCEWHGVEEKRNLYPLRTRRFTKETLEPFWGRAYNSSQEGSL